MRVYTVHEPPDPPLDRVDRGERLAFVKEGHVWAAMLFTPIWLLAKRLWWAFLVWLVVAALLELAVHHAGLDRRIAALVVLGLGVLIGLEADTLQRWGLSRRGWREIGVVAGASAEDCERRFLDQWLPTQPVLALGGFDEPRPPVASRTRPVSGVSEGGRAFDVDPGAAPEASTDEPPPVSTPAMPGRRWPFARLFGRSSGPTRVGG